MAVLRIADYLQNDAGRAPTILRAIHNPLSPESLTYMDLHTAIGTISYEHPDPDAIYVKVRPKDAFMFLKISDLLQEIQYEIDKTWAVLGEVYGARLRQFSEIGLRRIRSNIDDIEMFKETVPYLPIAASFSTATHELLRLLIKPLYGDRPAIGIRELVQNAIDACREMDVYTSRCETTIERNAQEADVVVSFEIDSDDSGQIWTVVDDQGIGMTPETVRDYFLKAGATFRESHAWRSLFSEFDGSPRVLRSGRFGIGALASFLLGNVIHVSTRHVNAPRGLEFTASLDDRRGIEFRHCDRAVGTTIKVLTPQSVVERLIKNTESWDWYRFATPSVKRKSLDGSTIDVSGLVPAQIGSSENGLWRQLSADNEMQVMWNRKWTDPILICNGLVIGEDACGGERLAPLWDNKYKIERPSTHILDPKAKLPLNLQRTGCIQSNMSFDTELLNDVCRDILAALIAKTPKKLPLNVHGLHHLLAAGTSRGERICPIWHTEFGIGLKDNWPLKAVAPRSAVVVAGGRSIELTGMGNNCACFVVERRRSTDTVPWMEFVCSGNLGIETPKILGRRVLIREDVAREVYVGEFEVAWKSDNWVLLESGDTEDGFISQLNLDRLSEREGHSSIIGEWYFDSWDKTIQKTEVTMEQITDIMQNTLKSRKMESFSMNGGRKATLEEIVNQIESSRDEVMRNLRNRNQPGPLSKLWQELIGQPLIPLNPEERKKLKEAYDTLDSRIRFRKAHHQE